MFSLKEIGREYNQKMLTILKESPIESGGLTICFDREPDIFLIPELTSERLRWVGFFKGDELLGFAMMAHKKVYVNKRPRSVMYFGNAYVKREGRKQRFVFRAGEYFMQQAENNDGFGYAVVMRGNKPAESYINKKDRRFPFFPYSKTISTLTAKNILITGRKRENSNYKIRPANKDDIDAITAMLKKEYSQRLFAPVVTKERLIGACDRKPNFNLSDYFVAKKNGRMVGVCAAWDASGCKQTRVIQYRKKYKIIRAGYAFLGRFYGFPPLPKKGEAFKSVTITDYAFENRDPEIMEAMLLKIYNEYRKKNFNMIIFGSYSSDPLLTAARRFYCSTVISQIILFSNKKSDLEEGAIDTSMPFIDMTLL